MAFLWMSLVPYVCYLWGEGMDMVLGGGRAGRKVGEMGGAAVESGGVGADDEVREEMDGEERKRREGNRGAVGQDMKKVAKAESRGSPVEKVEEKTQKEGGGKLGFLGF